MEAQSESQPQLSKALLSQPSGAKELLLVSLSLHNIHPIHTIPSPPYRRIQRRNKVRHNLIRIIQPRKNSYDIGARIRVLLRKRGIEEDCQGLSGKRMEKEKVCVRGWVAWVPRGRFRRRARWLA